MKRDTPGFDRSELKALERLNAPRKIQDFLDALSINFEKNGEACMSPRRVLRERKAHCMEGAMFAAAALWLHGERPLLLDLKTADYDEDHVVALFQRDGHWGALSKTNHAVLRYREPIYRTIRELALSYFHEYFLDDGRKTLRSYSRPFDLQRFRNRGWTTAEEDLWYIAEELDTSTHVPILTYRQIAGLRKADLIERKTGKITEWKP